MSDNVKGALLLKYVSPLSYRTISDYVLIPRGKLYNIGRNDSEL